MISLRKTVLIFALVSFLGTIFIFHESAKSAVDSSLQKAQEQIDSLTSDSTNDSPKGSTDESIPDTQNLSVKHEEPRENATMFTLCRNDDLWGISRAINSVEKQFNSKYHYDWVFLNDEDFTDEFKHSVSQAVSGTAHFGKVDSTMWGYPDNIDLERAAATRDWMKDHDVIYGDVESYHHMCRFQSGFFFQHPLMKRYKYAWRVEPSISILCKQKSDPFRLMRENELAYGFNIAPMDIPDSIRTLWDTTKNFTKEHKDYIHPGNLLGFISDDSGESYNYCHFWTNFEISDMDWLRSEPYQEYFDYLDQSGGFYYERWGDAPIRSIAASLFLPKDKIHFFNEIGYFHSPYGHCPYNQGPLELQCDCHPASGAVSQKFYDYHKDSCLRRYFQAKGRTYHEENPDMS